MLPNIVTIFGICVGLTAVRSALQGNVSVALYLLVLAMILDAADGRLARVMKSESKIGAELDTLADFFNFGIATPLVIYFTIFVDSDAARFGWIAVMIFSICCALAWRALMSAKRMGRNRLILSECLRPHWPV
jgi:CDP-diacylglycerol--serine O-phosphatidyltransferase